MSKAIYDKKYYKLVILAETKEFKDLVFFLLDSFDNFGIPVPKSGFKKLTEYDEWTDSFWNKWDKVSDSQNFKKALAKISNEKGQVPTENSEKYAEIKRKYLPPIFHNEIHNFLLERGFTRYDKGVKDFVLKYLFFGGKDFQRPKIKIAKIRRQKTNKMDFFVQLFPWTTKKDLIDNWPLIKKEQLKHFKIEITKNKRWENFERDYELFTLYKKLLD